MTTTRRAVLAAAGTTLSGAGCLGLVDRRGPPSCPATVHRDADARLGFVGDVMLGRGVDRRWRDGPPDGVWGDVHDHLLTLDGLFCNLECCLSDRGVPRPGRTYHFRAGPDWATTALSAGNVRFASLANNHLLDFGPDALDDTTTHLSEADLPHAGAGATLRAALQPAVVEVGPLRVGVVAFSDQSPSYAAGPERPGTAFVDTDPTSARTRRLVGEALAGAHDRDPDLLVASLHWGPNWEVRPGDHQRRFARWLVDQGVDLVHGHSAHVLQGVEVYEGRPIVYDAGDFVDDYAVKAGLHNDRSALFELHVADGVLDALRVVPIEIRRSAATVARPTAARWVRSQVRTLSEEFGTTVERTGSGLRIPLSACG